MLLPTTLFLLAAAAGVNAHGKLLAITGANGAKANGLAIVPGTPGTGSTKVTEVDTTIFGAKANRDPAATTGCGKTPGGGTVDCATAAAASLATSGGTVPTTDAAGNIALTFHQVNQDGAGPLSAMVSSDMGKTWQAATVSQNAPGTFGLSGTKNQDIPVTFKFLLGGTAGSASNVCLVALANPIAGFGGSAPFAMGGTAAKRSVSHETAALLEAAAPALVPSDGIEASDYETRSVVERDLPADYQIHAVRVKRELPAEYQIHAVRVKREVPEDPASIRRRHTLAFGRH